MRHKQIVSLAFFDNLFFTQALEAASPYALNSGLIRVTTLLSAGALKRRKRRAPTALNCIVTALAGVTYYMA